MSNKTEKWFVSRQSYWGEESPYAVEIAYGGLDYANPDMLCTKYHGEGEEYTDPREAATTAVEIAQAWRKDCPDKDITVRVGFTHGFTMPFDEDTDEAAIAWGEKKYELLPKCPHCGEVMEERWTRALCDDEDACCSENCANMYFEEQDDDDQSDTDEIERNLDLE